MTLHRSLFDASAEILLKIKILAKQNTINIVMFITVYLPEAILPPPPMR